MIQNQMSSDEVTDYLNTSNIDMAMANEEIEDADATIVEEENDHQENNPNF